MKTRPLNLLHAATLSTVSLLTAETHAVPLVSAFIDSGARSVQDINGIPLTAGLPAVDPEGTVVQLGYYSAAALGHPFDGISIPLIGEGSANTAFAGTTIGDNAAGGPGNGEIYLDPFSFFVGSPSTGMNLRPAGRRFQFASMMPRLGLGRRVLKQSPTTCGCGGLLRAPVNPFDFHQSV